RLSCPRPRRTAPFPSTTLFRSHVARAFDHHLTALAPRFFSQFTEGFELSQLCRVGGVSQAARSQAVAQRERHVVLAHDVADLVRSEEHTSELQSRENLVFHLLR